MSGRQSSISRLHHPNLNVRLGVPSVGARGPVLIPCASTMILGDQWLIAHSLFMSSLHLVGEAFDDSCSIINVHFLMIILPLEEGNINITKLIRTAK